jgi:hypothetical protein
MRINGNLVFNSDASGELQNVFIERVSTLPAIATGVDAGRIVFNTSNKIYYYSDGSSWVALATGGNATALQAEVDAIEATIGTAINANGTYNQAAFTGTNYLTGATSLTNALTLLDSQMHTNDYLADLLDVALVAPSMGQYLKYNGSKWYNETLVLADVTNVTATASELNTLHGLTATTTELNYVHGVTSPIQTQLQGKQPLSATLTGLAALTGTGIVVETSANTFIDRTLVAPATGMTISDITLGNATFAFTHNLLALEGLSGFGFVVKTADGVLVTESITGSTGRIVVTNGDGVASAPTIDLATVTQATSGNFVKVTLDGYGRVTGNTAVTTMDITNLVDSVYVNASGDTMTGTLTFTSGTVTGLAAPAAASDAATKGYVDAAITGLSWKTAVHVLSTANVSITSPGANIDGHPLDVGDRVLLIGQGAQAEDGIYVFNGANVPLTRSLDAATVNELKTATVFVQAGTHANTGWTQSNAYLNTDFTGQVWVQFSGGSVYTAGNGIAISGNSISATLGLGLSFDSSNAIALHLDPASALSDTTGALTLVLASMGGLEVAAGALQIKTAGVTNAMLVHSSVTVDADSGTGSFALGETLNVIGTSAQGISTSVATSAGVTTFTITAADASSSNKGVAKFATPTFAVTSGSVDIAAAGVTNAMLVNSKVTLKGDTGSYDLSLGTAATIAGAGAIHTAVSGSSLTVSVDVATATVLGVASFSATDFTVTAGAVALHPKTITNTVTDVAVTTPAAGQTLVYSTAASKFVNRPTYFLYSGASSTSHTVAHNLGQKYCNVTVVDSSDEVVIPQSITFVDGNSLTVTFTSAIACKVVVMGVNAA